MNQDKSSLIWLIFSILAGIILLIYHVYWVWFYPEKYTSDLRNSVKDWMPFANFYRRWFSSKLFLWITRISMSIVLLLLILLLSILFLGILGVFP